MGEFLTRKDGEQVAKAGTMDDFRYVRRTELEFWSPYDGGHGTDVGEILADPGTLYRFSFPDEDIAFPSADAGIDWDRIHQRDMDRTFGIFGYYMSTEIDHREIVQHIRGANMGTGINIWLPCPIAVSPYPLKTTTNGIAHVINIWGERYDGQGRGRTIFRCDWCGAPFSLGLVEMQEVRLLLLQEAKRRSNSWYADVSDRLKEREA